MKRIVFLMVSFILMTPYINAQEKKKFAVRTVAFYNVENLFDTINDPHKFDDDRTPEGADRWTSKVYNDHVHKIAKVISEIGSDVTKHAPDIVGLAEIENEAVVRDLINTQYLKRYNYGIVHYESPDARGVDVALIYKKSVFKPTASFPHPLYLTKDDGKPLYTRDQLLVSGELDGEMIHFIVNHWPSRFGGEAKSRPSREKAAALNKNVLKTKDKKEDVKQGELFNPMEAMLKKGMGTLAYQDGWNLFDQFYFTYDLLKEDKSSYRYWKTGIFNRSYLANPKGRYKGYPFRSMSNGNYTWGYSDHFPVYMYLIRELK